MTFPLWGSGFCELSGLLGSGGPGPSGVGDGRVGVEAQLGFVGAGADQGGDVVPGGAVEVGGGDGLGEPAEGLVDEAGEQVDEYELVAEVEAAPLGASAAVASSSTS